MSHGLRPGHRDTLGAITCHPAKGTFQVPSTQKSTRAVSRISPGCSEVV